jgi:hypothetical protein
MRVYNTVVEKSGRSTDTSRMIARTWRLGSLLAPLTDSRSLSHT